MDHIGYIVAERSDLDVWQQELSDHSVVHCPAEDTINGSALVFRYADNVQTELWGR